MNEIFRDPTEGATARRIDLLRRRRDELITMPHAVRRVVVARSARIAAGLVMCLGGIAMLVAAVSPGVTSLVARVLPGQNPAVLSQLLLLTWVLAIFVYALARSRAEHRFIVAMSRYVLPGDDLAHDIERLSHEHPDAVAKEMAHRLEIRSAAVPVIAASVVLPATALYVIETVKKLAWSYTFDYTAMDQAWWLAGSGVLGLVAALVIRRKAARAPVTATLAGGVTLIAVVAVPLAISQLGYAPVWLLTPAILVATIAVLGRRLRLERERIDAEDPAAGSELFTVKDAIAAGRRAIVAVRARVGRSTVFTAVAATLLLILGGDPIMKANTATVATAMPSDEQPTFVMTPEPLTSDDRAVAVVDSVGSGQLRVSVDLAQGETVNISRFAGVDKVPSGWRARLAVRLDGSAPGIVLLKAPGDGETFALDSSSEWATTTLFVCGPQRLGLQVSASNSDWPEGKRTARLIVTPTLEVGSCD